MKSSSLQAPPAFTIIEVRISLNFMYVFTWHIVIISCVPASLLSVLYGHTHTVCMDSFKMSTSLPLEVYILEGRDKK